MMTQISSHVENNERMSKDGLLFLRSAKGYGSPLKPAQKNLPGLLSVENTPSR